MAKEDKSLTSQDNGEKKSKRTKHPFVYFFSVSILMLIALTFVIGPASFQFLTGDQADFGAYKGERIVFTPGSFFAQQQQNLAEQYQNAGVEFNIQTIYQIWRTAYMQTLFHTALIQQAEETGFTVSSQMIDENMTRHPRFIRNGRFDAELYRSASPAEILQLRNVMRNSIIHQRMLDDLRIGTYLSDNESEFIASQALTRRAVSFVLFDESAFPNTEVINYVSTNPEPFQIVDLSVISVNSLEEAESIASRINGNEISFELAAEEYSVDSFAQDGGNRGLTFLFRIQQELGSASEANALFSTSPGEITSPILNANGVYSLFRLNESPRSINQDNPLELNQVRSYIVQTDQAFVQEYLQNEAESFHLSAQAIGIEQAANQAGFSLQRTVEFPINIGSLSFFLKVQKEDGTPLAGADASEDFYRSAFQLSLNEISQPIRLQNSYVVFSPISESKASEFELEYIASSAIPNAMDDWISQDIERTYLNPEFVEDNFDDAFFTHVYQF